MHNRGLCRRAVSASGLILFSSSITNVFEPMTARHGTYRFLQAYVYIKEILTNVILH